MGYRSDETIKCRLKHRRLALLIVLFSLVHVTTSSGQTRSEKISVVYSAIGSSQSPLWIALEAGIFKKHGLDVELLYVGGGSRAAQVVLAGEAPVAMLNAEFAIMARREGYRDLVDVATLGLTFPSSGLNTSRTFVRNRRETVLRVLRAYVDSIHYGITQKKFAVGVFGKYLKSQDTPFLEAVQEMYLGKYIPKIPYPSVESMQRALADVAERDPRGKGARAEQFIDASLMQDLEKEGFIKQLWR